MHDSLIDTLDYVTYVVYIIYDSLLFMQCVHSDQVHVGLANDVIGGTSTSILPDCIKWSFWAYMYMHQPFFYFLHPRQPWDWCTSCWFYSSIQHCSSHIPTTNLSCCHFIPHYPAPHPPHSQPIARPTQQPHSLPVPMPHQPSVPMPSVPMPGVYIYMYYCIVCTRTLYMYIYMHACDSSCT